VSTSGSGAAVSIVDVKAINIFPVLKMKESLLEYSVAPKIFTSRNFSNIEG
jgi:hypothetical protein